MANDYHQFVVLGSLIALALCSCLTSAMDLGALQDFCVADLKGPVRVNGFVCKDPNTVGASDFSFSGLHIPGNTTNGFGTAVTPVSVNQIPGLNTLGISMVRIDFAPWGVVAPHFHPRATEIVTVIEGCLEVGFVTSNPENRLVSKKLEKGDVFVFLVGLIHFQQNVGPMNAVAICCLSSQNPGVSSIPSVVFGSKPDISTDFLAKAFQVDKNVVQQLQRTF